MQICYLVGPEEFSLCMFFSVFLSVDDTVLPDCSFLVAYMNGPEKYNFSAKYLEMIQRHCFPIALVS
jgi:hypothetical protein